MRERIAQIGCYLCLIAIAAMLAWSGDIIKHTEFLR
jgi:hypothetical protein